MPLSNQTAFRIRDNRFKLEQLIALDLIELFNNTTEIKSTLLDMIGLALEEMLDEKNNIRFGDAADDEKFLSIWNKDFRSPSARFSLSDISDVIRLYGAFVEQMGGAPDAAKSKLRPAIGGVSKDVAWGQDRYAGGKRLREGTKVGEGAHKRDNPHTSKQHLAGGKLAGGGTRSGWQSYAYSKKQVRGIDLKQAVRGSLVRAIDDLFCLPIGADISGTTADTVYFIRHFSNQVGNFDIGLYLLPLATIARARHHSFLEIALALSANKEITGVDYRIGFYGSLIPDDSRYKSAISGIFERWQKHNWNRHVVMYFDKMQKLLGGFDFGTGGDFDRVFHEAAWLTKHYAGYQDLGQRPCELAVHQFLRRCGGGVKFTPLLD